MRIHRGSLFGSFVVGRCNRDAVRAVRRVAVDLRRASSSDTGAAVLVHGRSGVGKTLLASTLAEFAGAAGHDVHHVQAAEFVERLVDRVRRRDSAADEIEGCRGLVVVDGLEVLSGMPAMVEEFARTASVALQGGARFVGAETARVAPTVIRDLIRHFDTDGISTRSVRVDDLDSGTRGAILKQALGRREVQLDRRTMRHLASLPICSGAEVEGLATRLAAHREHGQGGEGVELPRTSTGQVS